MTERYPNLFLLGAPKCGTTFISQFLARHGEVYVPRLKEPQFFATDFPRRLVPSAGAYERLYREAQPSHRWRLDASTVYLYSRDAILNILRNASSSRFVVMVRDPVTMVPAWHNQMLLRFFEDAPSLEQAWQLVGSRKAGSRIPKRCPYPRFLYYDEIALYALQIGALLQRVPREDVHIIVYEDLATNPDLECRRLLQFLNLRETNNIPLQRVNARKGWRAAWLGSLAGYPPLRWCRTRLGLTVNGTEQYLAWLFRPLEVQPAPPGLVIQIRDAYAPDVGELEKLLGRSLPGWLGGEEAIQLA